MNATIEPTNIEMEICGDILTMRIDLGVRGNVSKTGKSLTVGTTHGPKPLPGRGDIFVGVNCYVKNPAFVKPPKRIKKKSLDTSEIPV